MREPNFEAISHQEDNSALEKEKQAIFIAGQLWLDLENNLGEEVNRIEKEGEGERSLRAKLVLGWAAQAVLSLSKKFLVGTGITLGTVGAYTAIDLDRRTTFEERASALKELQQNGIPSDQRYSAYKPGVSELIYRSVTPFGYQQDIDENGFAPHLFTQMKKYGLPNMGMAQDILANVRFGRGQRMDTLNALHEREMKEFETREIRLEDSLGPTMKDSEGHFKPQFQEKEQSLWEDVHTKYVKLAHEKALSDMPHGPHELKKGREDAWRMYLGLKQEHGTFSISDYKPAVGQEDKYYFSINRFWESLGMGFVPAEYAAQMKEDERKEINHFLGRDFNDGGMQGIIMMLSHIPGNKMIDEDQNHNSWIMGHFTLGLGKDEKGSYLYYYDKWDLASKFVDNPVMKGVGRPYEIYDRLYYDPATFQVPGNK